MSSPNKVVLVFALFLGLNAFADAPVITLHPTNTTATNGRSFALHANASGGEPLHFRWFFQGNVLSDSTRISGTTSSNLLIQSVNTNDAGEYFLEASNALGVATSEVAVVTVIPPPYFVQQPSNQVVPLGSNATFSAQVAGIEPLAFTWLRGATPLTNIGRFSGVDTATLVISNVTSVDAGQYKLVVTNDAGSATSVVVSLSVLTPPSFSTHPRSCSSVVGMRVKLSGFATGTAPIQYFWLKNDVKVTNANTSSLTITNVAPSDYGSYQLVASNQVGITTSTVARVTYGSVVRWGAQEYTPPADLTNVVGVSATSSSSYALQGNGMARYWGASDAVYDTINGVAISQNCYLTASGRLKRDGSESGTNATAIANASTYTLVLTREGTVFSVGQGLGSTIPADLTGVKAISTSGNNSVAVLSNGTVRAWGSGSITNVPAGLHNVVAVSAGFYHTIALTADGRITAWGTGPGVTNMPRLTNVMAIATGAAGQDYGHNLALLSNRTVVAWGLNNGGTNVPAGLTNVIAIGAGPQQSLAIVDDGRPLMLRGPVGGTAYSGNPFELSVEVANRETASLQWQRQGMAPTGGTIFTNLPNATNQTFVLTNLPVNSTTYVRLVASNHLGAVTSLVASVLCVAQPPRIVATPTNISLLFGNTLRIEPALIASLPATFQWRFNGTNIANATNRFLTVPGVRHANAGTYSLAITNSYGWTTSVPVQVQVLGPVVAWGGSANYPGTTNISSNLTNAIAIAVTANHNLALKSDGTVVSWGMTNSPGFAVPSNLTEVVEIATSRSYSLALRKDGTVVGWGHATNVSGFRNIASVEADAYGYSLLQSNGVVYRTTGISGLSEVVSLAPFDDGFFGVRGRGTIGYTGSGSPPPQNATNVLAVTAGRYHGVILRQNGTTQPWGSNFTNTFGGFVQVASSAAASFGLDGVGTPVLVGQLYAGDITSIVPSYITGLSMIDGGGSASHMLGLSTLRELNAITLSQATDTTNLLVSSRGAPQWYAQTDVTHDGVDAARSAAVEKNTASSMRMFVPAPSRIRFWWKVSSEPVNDTLTFKASGVEKAKISGEMGWRQETIDVPLPPYTPQPWEPTPRGTLVSWTYSKNGSVTGGDDAGWVDQIEILPAPPTVVTHPVPFQVVRSGTNVSLRATVSGGTPLTNQWYKNSLPVPGGTGLTLSLANVNRSDSGTYQFRASNASGTAWSSNAALHVVSPQRFLPPSFVDAALTIQSGDVSGGYIPESDLSYFEPQWSTNLLEWSPLTGGLIWTNGSLLLRDTNAPNEPGKFYRIIETRSP